MARDYTGMMEANSEIKRLTTIMESDLEKLMGKGFIDRF
jgi:hypothetical protein